MRRAKLSEEELLARRRERDRRKAPFRRQEETASLHLGFLSEIEVDIVRHDSAAIGELRIGPVAPHDPERAYNGEAFELEGYPIESHEAIVRLAGAPHWRPVFLPVRSYFGREPW